MWLKAPIRISLLSVTTPFIDGAQTSWSYEECPYQDAPRNSPKAEEAPGYPVPLVETEV